MDFLTSTTHLHITTWVITIILFLVAAFVQNKGLHMTLRLFYILVIITGGALFMEGMKYEGYGFEYGIKLLFGILLISMMEMVLMRKSKNKSTTVFWVLFGIFLFLTLFVGFKLPMGMNFLMNL